MPDASDQQPNAAPNPGGDTTPQPNPKLTNDTSPSAPTADPATAAAAVIQPSRAPGEHLSTQPKTAGEATDTTAATSDAAVAVAPDDPRADWYADDIERHPALHVLREQHPDAVLAAVRFRNETTIHVAPDALRAICRTLRGDARTSLTFLSDLTVLDMLRLRERPRFDVVVQLYSLRYRTRVRLKAGVDDGQSVPSLVPIWNGANWMEREAYDMFGIQFDGHPNLKRILLADDWSEGHPLRKDYPLRGWSEYRVYNTERTVPRVRTRWTGRQGTA